MCDFAYRSISSTITRKWLYVRWWKRLRTLTQSAISERCRSRKSSNMAARERYATVLLCLTQKGFLYHLQVFSRIKYAYTMIERLLSTGQQSVAGAYVYCCFKTLFVYRRPTRVDSGTQYRHDAIEVVAECMISRAHCSLTAFEPNFFHRSTSLLICERISIMCAISNNRPFCFIHEYIFVTHA